MTDLVQRLRNHALPDPYDEREVMHAPLLREAADHIEGLEAHVKKLEAIAYSDDGAGGEGMKLFLDTLQLSKQLTASRAQVNKLVEALKKIRMVLWATRDLEVIDEALAAVEKEPK